MKNEKLYKKYPHIIPGSIENIPRGHIIKCGKGEELISHGKICIIKCATDGAILNCKKTRIINLQDAKQVKQCKYCTKYMKNIRRKQRRSNI